MFTFINEKKNTKRTEYSAISVNSSYSRYTQLCINSQHNFGKFRTFYRKTELQVGQLFSLVFSAFLVFSLLKLLFTFYYLLNIFLTTIIFLSEIIFVNLLHFYFILLHQSSLFLHFHYKICFLKK